MLVVVMLVVMVVVVMLVVVVVVVMVVVVMLVVVMVVVEWDVQLEPTFESNFGAEFLPGNKSAVSRLLVPLYTA
ncbi:hypothetical protein Pmani_016571 [Petrolisthes manimaculis]|uniref:Uncharacterized protein n=1 Tax=Petrolisthes manimaculis TaxID=1843537 RepID=A0AAE1PPF5_9EUCA|nr:hypothetical protein Pmani_016571 [Petrolisthes manimaculis]